MGLKLLFTRFILYSGTARYGTPMKCLPKIIVLEKNTNMFQRFFVLNKSDHSKHAFYYIFWTQTNEYLKGVLTTSNKKGTKPRNKKGVVAGFGEW